MERRSQICLVLAFFFGICSATAGQTGPDVNRVCDACLEFSNEAQLILSSPDTQKQAVDLITQLACQSLTPRLKTKCVDMVTGYVPDALVALQAYLGPEICTTAGLCSPERSYLVPQGQVLDLFPLADAKTCVLCQDFATDALDYLGSASTKSKIIGALHLACAKLEDISKQCDLLVDIYALDFMEHLDNITPEEFCETTRFCKPTRKASVAVPGVRRNDCAICQFVVLEVKIKLEDPVTQEKLLEVLFNGCDRVQNHVDECKLIVEEYAPFILANLDTMLDAGTLCAKIGVCPPRKVEAFEPLLAMYSERNARHVHSL